MSKRKRMREIRARLDRAPQGPWYVHLSGKASHRISSLDDEQILKFIRGEQDDAAVDLICHAPDDIAFLLGELDRLRQPRWWRRVEP
jgi:hypothetical protein